MFLSVEYAHLSKSWFEDPVSEWVVYIFRPDEDSDFQERSMIN